MITYEEATELIYRTCPSVHTKTLPIEKTPGYVVSEDVISSIDVSPFRSSAMDGFAVRAEWLSDSSESNPTRLPVETTVYAGDSVICQRPERTIVRIMTGAPVPEGFDSVVRLEDATSNGSHAVFTQPVTRGENVRQAGEDVGRGETVARLGEKVSRLDVGLFAAIGLRELNVFRRPSAMIACTGNELVLPGEPLSQGKIYNSNCYSIRSLIEPVCERVVTQERIDDSESSLRKVFESTQDVIITSGGVSAGDKDHVTRVARQCGFDTIFHKVAIKPGKPLYFAKRDRQLLFGLPGNPLSAVVTCAVFVLPALKKIAGVRDYRISNRPARIVDEGYRKSERLLIWPAKVVKSTDIPHVSLSSKKSSASLSALRHTDGLVFQGPFPEGGSPPEISFISWQELLAD